ncbi:alpha-glucan phosphorylase [Mizugakiibacter sediminis]|uniref:Alpha-glucan phosphorylase n=1 Tax=Mizugakiibacter sediminis TaxID=1475481 RepID=A0A0K8QPU9_9GAMM|nr:alpha-glucan family phosphorylase [Mizugakiibacter sediminis]GAP66929.1 alpha-glucan phosphorylase [Mizugakiibacter sediminis]
MTGTAYTLEVRPALPPELAGMDDLAGNLLYSWDRRVRRLFYQIDPQLWERCSHNPKLFLRRVDQVRLQAYARDSDFLKDYREVLGRANAYNEPHPPAPGLDPGVAREHVAYFCMEYGLHESLHLYSGGLGILAGDFCKAASDAGVPFTAVGLMYRSGYFTQTIGRDGRQQTHFHPTDPCDLPVTPARDADGWQVRVTVPVGEREVQACVWQAVIGRVRLLLLDTDVEGNSPDDRAITYQLYGGDRDTRIAQELVLGVGGVRALRALGVHPTIWHLNEGHPALMILELCREAVASGLDFASALELTAASVVFTTHTPVAAGHDRFPRPMAAHYLAPIAAGLGVDVEQVLALGALAPDGGEFDITTLALRGSRHRNGVSRVHRDVAARMFAHVWPQLDAEDLPLVHVTNGVHVPTFLAREWSDLFDEQQPDWRSKLRDADYWKRTIDAIPSHRFWGLRQSLKCDMLEYVACVLERQYRRASYSRARIDLMRRVLSADYSTALVIGFARRITAYKRPLLIFRDLQRLGRLLTDPERPVVLICAGKAHPQDGEGQAIIHTINALAGEPPLLGSVFFVEGYDIALARRLVSGVDVWLNTPSFPQEACGTSGQKAAINGALNLSVLDGWWAEGYDGGNGWAVTPRADDAAPEQRDTLEAEELLDLLEHEIVPLYHRRNAAGLPEGWVARAKAAMRSTLPRFNTDRMLADYLERLYLPGSRHRRLLEADGGEAAAALAAWRARIRRHWGKAALRWAAPPPDHAAAGMPVTLRVVADLGELGARDVVVECVIGRDDAPSGQAPLSYAFAPEPAAGDEQPYALEFTPPLGGLLRYRIRMYPTHPALAHPLETGCMLWL